MNSVEDPHLNKRIKEFLDQGYQVRLYGFDRLISTQRRDDVVTLGSFSNKESYLKRIKIYYQGIKSLASKNNDGIWYYQGLDVAMFAVFLIKNCKYIYEECDLVHTYISNPLIKRFLEFLDKKIIKKSYKTILTSEGFIQYHYKHDIPNNIVLIPNKLSPSITKFTSQLQSKAFDSKHIKFAFVGGVRYKSLINLGREICKNYPQHEFHFYGYISETIPNNVLPKGNNVFWHGPFKNPDDLPKIYSNIDIIVAAYDTEEENVCFLEPNKLYEAIYFRKPIIVSRGTFIEDKVNSLGIGYSVDAWNQQDIKSLVSNIEETYQDKIKNLTQIPQSDAIEDINNAIKILK